MRLRLKNHGKLAFGGLGVLFAAEFLLGGILHMVLHGRAPLRARPAMLFLGAVLATAGVVFNRVNVVFLAMELKGSRPQIAPAPYTPSIFEWGISVGLIAPSVFLFGLGARIMPILPKEEVAQG